MGISCSGLSARSERCAGLLSEGCAEGGSSGLCTELSACVRLCEPLCRRSIMACLKES